MSTPVFNAPLRSPRPIYLPTRDWLWKEANRKCHWCNCVTYIGGPEGPQQATIDHVVPRCVGGIDKPENMVLACSLCNRRRNVEHQRGLPEGALLGTYTTVYGKKTTRRLPPPPVVKGIVSPLDVLRNQRDQGIAEITKLREEIEVLRGERSEARKGCKRLREQMQGMTFREFVSIVLQRWARKLRSSSSS